MHEITVRPCEVTAGWTVEHRCTYPMQFLSALAAEKAARDLVARLEDAGHPARATFLLRDGSLGGKVTRF